jgi:hypothetical protein
MIQHYIKGVFFPYRELLRYYNLIVTKLSNKSGISLLIISALPKYYNFNKLIKLPLDKIGNNIYKTHIEVYRKWVDTYLALLTSSFQKIIINVQII